VLSTPQAFITLPSTAEAQSVAALAQIEHLSLNLDPVGEWRNVATLNKLNETLTGAPTPTIIYDDTSYISTFLLLLHLAREDGEVRVSGHDVFGIGASMGFDFGADPELVALVKEVTGDDTVTTEKIISPHPMLTVGELL